MQHRGATVQGHVYAGKSERRDDRLGDGNGSTCSYSSSYKPALAGRKRLRGQTPVAQVESRVKPASSDSKPPAVPGSGAAGGGAALARRKKFRGKTPVAQVESSVKPASSDTLPPAVPSSGAAGGGGK